MRALIAMSGGVDSSVAAALVSEAGNTCTGCTMRLYENDMIGLPIIGTCCSLKDTEDARAVCNKLGIDYKIFHYEELFRQKVIEKFVSSYEKGITPNPCIDCNRYFKFDHLYDNMEKLGYDTIVTGHYARIEFDEARGRYLLRKGVDHTKDQSYVLYTLTQYQLEHTYLPLGEYSKAEVRQFAEEHGFVNARKHDSQDICFVPDGNYVGFMERYRGKSYPEGDIVDTTGKVLGRHNGYVRYTIGQRKGLGIASDRPLFVVRVEPRENRVVVGYEEELFHKTVTAGDVNLISVERIDKPMRITAKIRYGQKEQPGVAEMTDDGRLKVVFDEAQRAPARGQALVMYDGDIVVGGGVID